MKINEKLILLIKGLLLAYGSLGFIRLWRARAK